MVLTEVFCWMQICILGHQRLPIYSAIHQQQSVELPPFSNANPNRDYWTLRNSNSMSGTPGATPAPNPFTQLFFCNQYPKNYFHTIQQNEADIPVTSFVPFDNNTPISRLFRFKAWRHIPWDYNNNGWVDTAYMKDPQFDYPIGYYQRLIPALQLATILIDRARPFFVHLLRGNVIQNGNDYSLDPNFVSTQADEDAYDLLQNDLADDLMFSYIPRRPLSLNTVTNGLAWSFQDMHILANKLTIPHIGIASEILYEITLSNFYTKPQVQREVMFVSLAQLLLHEYAHVMWLARNWEDRFQFPNALPPPRDEPFIPPANWHELGYISSIVVFGFTMNFAWPIGRPQPSRNGEDGLRATYLDTQDYMSTVLHRRVSDETIHSFFNRLTWQPRPDGRMKVLDIHLLDVTVNENSNHATQNHNPTPGPSVNPVVVRPVPTPSNSYQDGSVAFPFVIR